MFLLLTFDSENDRDKFETLYSKYKKLMLYKAYEVLKDYSLAEDAVSEAFLRVYKNLRKIDDPNSNKAAAFLMTVTRNAALTMLDRQQKNRGEELQDTISDEFDLERSVVSEMSHEAIYSVLNQLSEELRSVFVLKYAHDLSHREIGRLLGISENNVTVRLFRAKKKLAQMLVKGGYAHEI